MSEEKGVWRTVSGRRIFIKDGQSLTDAMRESGKFKGEDLKKAGKGDGKPKEDTEEKTAAPSIETLLGKEYKGVKGQAAVDKLLKEKQGHVKGAFHRDDMGDIDLVWGNDDCGLQHILKRRGEQGIDTDEFMQNLSEVVEKGNFRKKNARGNFEFMHEGKIAVISPELNGNKITFLLTAFKTHSKK